MFKSKSIKIIVLASIFSLTAISSVQALGRECPGCLADGVAYTGIGMMAGMFLSNIITGPEYHRPTGVAMTFMGMLGGLWVAGHARQKCRKYQEKIAKLDYDTFLEKMQSLIADRAKEQSRRDFYLKLDQEKRDLARLKMRSPNYYTLSKYSQQHQIR